MAGHINGRKASRPSNQKNPEPLTHLVLPGAKDVVYSKLRGSNHVRYELTEKFPAKHTIEEISTRLANQGWKPVKISGQKARQMGLKDGFLFFEDGRTKPEQSVQRWLTEWHDSAGNTIVCDIEYRWPWRSVIPSTDPSSMFIPTTNRFDVYFSYTRA